MELSYVVLDCTPALPELLAREFTVRGMVTSGTLGASAQVMERMPSLGIVANLGVGVDQVDLETARARGIVVTNTPDVLTESVAELALALMLACARRLTVADRQVPARPWLSCVLPICALSSPVRER